jgi:hypothetical protein
MNHRFAIFAFAVFVGLGRMLEAESRAQAEAASGHQLVAEAARRLDAETSIAAELRYRVNAYGQQLLGAGSYLQSGPASQRQLRLDLRTQVGDKPATLLEIRDREFFWVRRDLPPNPPTLGRIDLAQLRWTQRRGNPQADQPATEDALPRGAWIMLGGLPRLLAALDQNFDFAAPKSDEVQLTGGDQSTRLPIWVLAGRWKPARLTALAGKSAKPSEQFPERVELVLDRSDQALPLFPYRISYWRAAEANKSGGKEPSEMLTLELFNVRRVGPIEPREFQFDAQDQEVLNLTSAYAQQIGGR